ncbi:unnamed protein product [Trichobilharzia szidati]|nr:unnamed protein product [Trichobilharzia szidati]
MSVEDPKPMDCSPINNNNRLCAICLENEFKYKCPKCEIKTCSLSCCNNHKSQFNCNGICDTVTYCRREDYSTFLFQRDYRLLEEIDRRNADREKQLLSLSHRNTGRIRKRNQLVKLASEYGITLRLSPTLILSRTKVNRTRIHIQKDEPKSILWSVEFSLIPLEANSTPVIDQSKSLRLVVHDQEQQRRLCNIWDDHVLNVSSEKQDSLITYSPPRSPPFGKISSWLHCGTNQSSDDPTNSMNKVYFYVKVQEISVPQIDEDVKTTLTRRYKYVEIFTTNRLIDILTIPGLIIHEMPTIYVTKHELNSSNTT